MSFLERQRVQVQHGKKSLVSKTTTQNSNVSKLCLYRVCSTSDGTDHIKFGITTVYVQQLFTAALNGAPVPLRHFHGRVEERILAERPPPNLPHHPELFLHPHGEGEPRVRLGTALVTPHTPRHRRR